MFPINKNIFIIFALVGFVYTQSKMNSYGMGNPGLYRDVASSGLSSSGLFPGYGKKFSLMNPSTWSSSKYTLFSSTFKGITHLLNYENIQNQSSNIDWLFFIVPINQRYAFGIGLFPYADHNVQFGKTDIMTPDSSLSNQKVDFSGGVSSLRFAFGFPLSSFGLGGLGFDLLFGSSRVHKSTEINEEIYILDQRKLFNGIVSQLYFTSNPVLVRSKEITFYFNLGFTIRDFSAELQSYQPFIDINQNGVHDISLFDFPGIDNSPDPFQKRYQEFYNPLELNFAINIKYASEISLIYEGGLWKNNSTISDELFEFGDGLSKKIYFSQGLIKYADKFPKNIIDKFHLRTGYSISQMYFQNNSNKVDKFDFSVGMGLPFGKFGNQIDFAYTFSKIINRHFINEDVKTIKIGLTIGDIWFVKRRNR